ncbi:MAG: carbohydrate-binding protein, partial [Bacillota bacterium]|nr:carbohydrate-binding protein [Bacillota bacterium]
MGMILRATSAVPYNKAFISKYDNLRVGTENGDFAVLKNVDFGEGKRGFKATHSKVIDGVALIELHLDKKDGDAIGVIACASQDMGGNFYTVWCEIKKTEGFHDVYLVFRGITSYSHFEFTDDSPYDHKDYTPVPASRYIDSMADTWEATDMLGRKIPSPEECKDRRSDKKVGIFYWTWHEGESADEPQNLAKILKDFPEAEWDINHHIWKEKICHWGEPLFGYYRNSDPYIIRKHAIMLASAGVDFLVFDTTNCSGTKKEAYRPLLEGLYQAKMDGIKVPQITFIMNFWAKAYTEFMLRSIYQDIYKPGLYKDLWFMVDGKPLLIAHPEFLPENGASPEDTKFLNEIREFFTFRPGQPGYTCGPNNNQEWGWLESAPQHKYCVRPDGSVEEMTVGVAQNGTAELQCTHFNAKGTFGRSYTHAHGHDLLTPDSYKYGYNFQEQWDNALEIDPDHIFVTGWNEWIMARFANKPWIREEGSTQIAFIDQYDLERSRDIEPDKDGYLDTYYLQLCANVRKFKGTAKLPAASAPKTIDFSEGEKQWENVSPNYINPKGSTPIRNYPGFGSVYYK